MLAVVLPCIHSIVVNLTLDPDVDHIDALAPYQPVQMRVVYCPIDTRLSFAQANKLVRDLKPRFLVVPEQYTTPPSLQPGRTDLVIEPYQSSLIKHREIDEIQLPIKRNYVTVDMDPKVSVGLLALAHSYQLMLY